MFYLWFLVVVKELIKQISWGTAPQTKIEHVLYVISKVSTNFLKNNTNILKQIVWETQNGIEIFVGQVLVVLIKTICTRFDQ